MVNLFLLKQTGGAHTVLRVIVEHMVYPVTLDVIHQIFSRVGKVIKIVTFTKNNTFQVAIRSYLGLERSPRLSSSPITNLPGNSQILSIV